MIRLIIFLVIVAVLGFGFAWFAERPGDVVLSWQGTQYETSLMVALTAIVALVAALMIGWWLISAVIRSPALLNRFFRNRRRDRGYHALSKGLIAASYGDGAQARKLSKDSRKLLGSEPLVELLDAQTSLLEGNRESARKRFESMLDEDDTRLVALRGLYLEAEREGESLAARHYAEEASQELPGLAWAGNATLKYQALDANWEGAMRTLENLRAAGSIGKPEAARKRAVLLTAQAYSEEQAEPEKAASHAREAHKLAPGLVPAAVIGAAALVRTEDLRRAAKMLESVWKKSPHPEIADAYVHLRSGDSVLDRLKRAKKLAGMAPGNPEGQMAIAEAAVEAQEWEQAREAMKPLLEAGPTQRACLIMADIEEGEYGDRGRMQAWLSRAVRAPRDPVWIADGHTSDKWLPVSPVSGEVDAFEWKVPLTALGEALELPDVSSLGEPLAELPSQAQDSPIPADVPEALDPQTAAATAATNAAGLPANDDKPRADKETVSRKPPVATASNRGTAAEVTADPAQSPGTAGERVIEGEVVASPEPPAEPATVKADGEKTKVAGPESEEEEAGPTSKDTGKKPVFPFDRPPDDPGVEENETEEDKRFRLF